MVGILTWKPVRWKLLLLITRALHSGKFLLLYIIQQTAYRLGKVFDIRIITDRRGFANAPALIFFQYRHIYRCKQTVQTFGRCCWGFILGKT